MNNRWPWLSTTSLPGQITECPDLPPPSFHSYGESRRLTTRTVVFLLWCTAVQGWGELAPLSSWTPCSSESRNKTASMCTSYLLVSVREEFSWSRPWYVQFMVYKWREHGLCVLHKWATLTGDKVHRKPVETIALTAGAVCVCPWYTVWGNPVWRHRDISLQTERCCGSHGPELAWRDFHWIPAAVSSQNE